MGGSELLIICGSAFLTVFIILSLLALGMRLIILSFPYKGDSSDSAVYAAVTTVVSNMFPGSKISKIEEIK
jgi:hypothetical protein